MPIVENEDGTLRYKSAEYWIPKPWVGLTNEEFKFIASKYLLNMSSSLGYFQDEIEAKLKEKNT